MSITPETVEPWWKSAVVYQIYPRSFADSTGNGVGDLEGIRAHLDHVQWVGANAIWLSPFYKSPMADFGYDVSDFCAVDPLFGDLDDFDRVVAAAREHRASALTIGPMFGGGCGEGWKPRFKFCGYTPLADKGFDAVYAEFNHRIAERLRKAGMLDKAYATGRKYAQDFKKNMTIKFDDFLPKWNDTAIPDPN